jgi:prephenate dehydrogenase
MAIKEIGIIGLGRFGRFAAGILKKDFRVLAYDSAPGPRIRGLKRTTLAGAAQPPVVVLCVPISRMEPVCRSLAPLLRPGQLVIDTCSVKEWPLEIMLKWLPREVEILGSHPLFGPDSARYGIQGQRIALCRGRGHCVPEVREYLTSLGLQVIVTSPARHDREMAKTQALFHFLARGVAALNICPSKLTTPGPAKLFHDFEDVQNDSLQLFRDLESRNRFAAPFRRRLLQSMEKINQELSRLSG